MQKIVLTTFYLIFGKNLRLTEGIYLFFHKAENFFDIFMLGLVRQYYHHNIKKCAGNCSGKCEKITTKSGNLIFTLKFMMQNYRHNCHVAPYIWRILLKNIFTDLLKMSRLARRFSNFSHIPKNYDPLSRRWF